MLAHYLLTALRSFRRQWVTSTINVIGLALGLACFFGALAYVRYFASDDRQYAGASRTYYVSARIVAPGLSLSMNTVAWAVADALKLDLPNAESIARVTLGDTRSITVGDRTSDLQVSFAEPAFLDLFPQKFIAGDASRALVEPGRAVLTRDVALRLFGTTSALGRTLLFENIEPLTVAGVIDAPAQPSHFGTVAGNTLRFDMLVSAATLPAFLTQQQGEKFADTALHAMSSPLSALTYVRVRGEGEAAARQMRDVLSTFPSRHGMNGAAREFGLAPISQLRNRPRDDWGVSLATVLTAAAAFVLLVSGLNYANLATALALARQRELGVRCVLGAARRQIAVQLLVDASVALLVATAIAFALIGACREVLFTRLNADLTFAWSQAGFWVIVGAALVGLVGLLCSYPVLVLSRLRLASSLQQSRATLSTTKGARSLVTLQFLLAALLLLTLSLARLQLEAAAQHAREAISAPILAIDNDLRSAGVPFDVLKQQLLVQPGVEAVAATSWVPFGGTYGVSYLLNQPDGARVAPLMNHSVTREYFDALGIKVLAGHLPVPTDAENTETIIARDAARQLGFSDPAAAIGQPVFPGGLTAEGVRSRGGAMHVAAVVEDNVLQTNFGGATASMYHLTEHSRIPLVRLSRAQLEQGRAAVDAVWAKLAPHRVLRARFLDERIDDFLAHDRDQTELMGWLTGLTIAIALMGLAGMSIHLANRRRHEVAVRKTLGARTDQVLALLLTELSLPILIGNVLAWPVAYLLAHKYSESFVYRAPFSFAACAITLVAALALAWLCAGWYSLRTARLNPAEVLRDQ